MSAMKQYTLGGTGLVLYLLQKLERPDQLQCTIHFDGNGYLDEVFVRINGELHYLWRAVDHVRQGSRSVCDQEAGSKGCSKVSEENSEAVRQYKSVSN